MKLLVNDKEYVFDKEISLIDIYDFIDEKLPYPVLAAYVDNDLHELNYKISHDCKINYIDFTSREGNRIYQKGLIFLLFYVFTLLYRDKTIKVCHSIDKGIRIKTNIVVTSEELNRISNKMKEVSSLDMAISKCLVRKSDAINYFKKMNNINKVNSLKYITNHYINLYKLGNVYEYFYSILPLSTNVFTNFSLLKINETEFVLQFPGVYTDGKIPEYVSREKIVNAYDENYKLAKKLGIFTSSDINHAIASERINDIIMLNEVVSNNNLLNLAKNIYDKKDKIKLVLIAGPSSSGKTTTARKLSMFLKSFGLNSIPLSMDNYFIDRKSTPKLPNGEYDFESINALDINLFNDHLSRLLNGESVSMPTYNFKTGEKEYLGNNLNLKDNDILIVEGLHGLNEKLTSKINKENKYKIYVSPFTDLNIDDLNMASTSDIRLIRAIIRDNKCRGKSAIDTIKGWNKVRDGEEINIFPFQQEADFVYNSALIYEIGVLKLYVEPLLYDIDSSNPYYEEVRRLINFLSMFISVPPDKVPEESVLREFIGGSYFE